MNPLQPGDAADEEASDTELFPLEDDERVVDPLDDIVDDELEEGEGEDLFGDGFERFRPMLSILLKFVVLRDYKANNRLDQYDNGNLDDVNYSEMSLGDRVAVDAVLNRRDRELARQEGRIPGAFLDDHEMDDEIAPLPRRQRHRNGDATDRPYEDEYDPNSLVILSHSSIFSIFAF